MISWCTHLWKYYYKEVWWHLKMGGDGQYLSIKKPSTVDGFNNWSGTIDYSFVIVIEQVVETVVFANV